MRGLAALMCVAIVAGLASCGGPKEITDEYVVALAKPHIEANPPPSGFVPVVEWNKISADEQFVYLLYVPERFVNLKEIEGVYLHNAAMPEEYNHNYGNEPNNALPLWMRENVPLEDIESGAWMSVIVVHRAFRRDSQLSPHMKDLLESVDDRPSFNPNQRFDIEDIVVDGAEGWFAYAQTITGKPEMPTEVVDARVTKDAWVLRFTYFGPWDQRSEREFLEGVEEARQILESFKVLEHVKYR